MNLNIPMTHIHNIEKISGRLCGLMAQQWIPEREVLGSIPTTTQ